MLPSLEVIGCLPPHCLLTTSPTLHSLGYSAASLGVKAHCASSLDLLPAPWDFLLSPLGFSQSTVFVHQFTLKESKLFLISSFWLLYFGAGNWPTGWEKANRNTPKSLCFLAETVWEMAANPFTELKKTQDLA